MLYQPVFLFVCLIPPGYVVQFVCLSVSFYMSVSFYYSLSICVICMSFDCFFTIITSSMSLPNFGFSICLPLLIFICLSLRLCFRQTVFVFNYFSLIFSLYLSLWIIHISCFFGIVCNNKLFSWFHLYHLKCEAYSYSYEVWAWASVYCMLLFEWWWNPAVWSVLFSLNMSQLGLFVNKPKLRSGCWLWDCGSTSALCLTYFYNDVIFNIHLAPQWHIVV